MKNRKVNHVGMVLRKLRKERHLSQEELAFRCSLDRSYISALERELKNPRLDTLFALAEGLEMKASNLVVEIENDLENNWCQKILTHNHTSEWKRIQQNLPPSDFQV